MTTARLKRARAPLMILAGFIVLLAPAGALAQDPSIVNALFDKEDATGQPFVEVVFSEAIRPEHEGVVLKASNYRVSRISAGDVGGDRFVGVEKVTFTPDPAAGREIVRVFLSAPVEFSPDQVVTIYFFGKGPDGKMSFAGKALKAPLVRVVTIPKPRDTAGGGSGGEEEATERTPPGPGFTLKEAKGRDDAHIYFEGDLHRASGTDFTGSVDLKVAIPVVNTARNTVLPKLDLMASNDPEADPDTINAGVEVQSILAQAGIEYRASSPVSGILWYNTAQIEGDRDFDNINAIWKSQFRFRMKNLFFSRRRSDTAFAVFIPFVGVELGKNLDSPVSEAQGRGVARILVGSELFVRLYQGETSFARVTLDGRYERRWPLLPEVVLRDTTVTDENGEEVEKTVAAFFGKRPRQWAEASLNYNLSELFGIFAGYEYGELPPGFKLVDHAFKIGVKFKARIK